MPAVIFFACLALRPKFEFLEMPYFYFPFTDNPRLRYVSWSLLKNQERNIAEKG
jgi:hypothetical protein